VRLSEAQGNKPKPLKIEFDGGGILAVTYRVPEYTPKQAAQLMSGDASRDPMVMAEMACKVIESWDLTEDDDTPIALDVESVADKVKMPILAKILEAVNKDSQPGEAAAPSDAG
jgi:hypothetical protein